MKKLWTIMSIFLLLGCGLGSSSNSNPTVSNGTGATGGSGGVMAPDTPAGNVVVNITDVTARSTNEKATEAVPPATRMRLLVTNPSIRFTNGSAYKLIVDGSHQTTITGLAFPVGSGYTFEIVTYAAGTPNRILNYAKASPVTIPAAGGTVNLTTDPVLVSISGFPSPTVYSGQILNLTANITQPSPLQTTLWNLFLGANVATGISPLPNSCQISSALHTTGTPNHVGVRAPIISLEQNTTGTILCAQGEFYIRDTFIDTTPAASLTIYDADNLPSGTIAHSQEFHYNWTFNYPMLDVPDPQLSADLRLQPAGIGGIP